MDIPRVLGGDGTIPGINNDQFKNMYWGPCANTGHEYSQLSSYWPTGNPALPTEQEMLDYWNQNWG